MFQNMACWGIELHMGGARVAVYKADSNTRLWHVIQLRAWAEQMAAENFQTQGLKILITGSVNMNGQWLMEIFLMVKNNMKVVFGKRRRKQIGKEIKVIMKYNLEKLKN